MTFLLHNPKISFFRVVLLWSFLSVLSLQAGQITAVRSGAGYVLLLGQLHNHFTNSLGFAAEGSYQMAENAAWA